MDLKYNNSKINWNPLHRTKLRIQSSSSCRFLGGALLLGVLLFIGCSGTRATRQQPPGNAATPQGVVKEATIEKISALRNDLADLNRRANMLEAGQVAKTAITYSSDLAAEYDLVRPAVLHNVFVRMGIKDRGLCYHWAEDLMQRLQQLDLKTYQLHWGVAYRGSELREHNSVVITARGEPFETGMVLDPWRNSGDLYWALIQGDEYPWKERPAEEW